MFTINNKSDYALVLLGQLIKKEKDFVPLSKLVKKTQLPPRFVARIAADLVRHGILASKEGKIGGYKIVKKLSKVTLFEFLKVFEKDVYLVKCQNSKYHCDFKKVCNHNYSFSKKLTGIVTKELHRWTLGDFIYE